MLEKKRGKGEGTPTPAEAPTPARSKRGRKTRRHRAPDEPSVALVVDEDSFVRHGVQCMLLRGGITHEVREAPDPGSAVTAAETLPAGSVVLLDFDLAAQDDYALARRLAEMAPSPSLVLFVGKGAGSLVAVHAAFGAGVTSVISTEEMATELAGAVRSAVQGNRFLGPMLGAMLMSEKESQPEDELSAKELDVLRLLALGHTSKEIGEQVGISARTVETYRSRLARKLDLKSRAEIVRYAIEHALFRVSMLV